jgi:hypothetical protein
VRDGTYELRPHRRGNGDEVLALWNPDLGVYYTPEEKGSRPGRFLILIHPGNYVEDSSGCCLPGQQRTISQNRRMVTSSRVAMRRLMKTEWKTLHIIPACGTED